MEVVKKFKDTERLSPAAGFFQENGYYCRHPFGTKGYYEHWDEERRRCMKGYTTPEGDITITGYHYFYLNYCVIRIAVDEKLDDGTIISHRRTDFPRFYDSDYRYFHTVDTARKNNKHLSVLKARRKGYSYKAGAMLCRNYFLMRHSKNYVFAQKKEFLTGVDGVLTKTWEIMDHVDTHTAFAQPRLLNTSLEKTSGYQKKINGQFVDAGFRSSIAGVSMKDDSDKVRGKAGELMFYEEGGAFQDLTEVWNKALPTMKQGNRTLGMMVAFGTGGSEEAAFEGLNNLFYDPDAYECMEFENIWDEGALGTTCGYFIPIYEILEGFIDDDGNSLVEEAKAFEAEQREKKRKGKDHANYDQYIAEHPLCPAEATLAVDTNLFDLAAIQEQINRIKIKGLHRMGTAGYMRTKGDGKVEFVMDGDARPIDRFPHKKGEDLSGAVVMYEAPYRTGQGVPRNLYMLCHDPYAQNQTSGVSLGAAYIIKRVNNMSYPDDCIVASYVGRPKSLDEYNKNLFALAQYYNAKIGFENDRGDVIGYAKRFRKLHWLQEEFQMLDKKELQSGTVKRNYGMHMTKERKLQGELYIRDWLNTPRGKTAEGDPILNVHRIYDVGLLEELKKFNQEGNFDRVMALMIGMYHNHELFNSEVHTTIQDRSQDEWFDRQYSGGQNVPYPITDGEIQGDDNPAQWF
jgi:hypothetical protein